MIDLSVPDWPVSAQARCCHISSNTESLAWQIGCWRVVYTNPVNITLLVRRQRPTWSPNGRS